jgi:hypothetical protein
MKQKQKKEKKYTKNLFDCRTEERPKERKRILEA